MKEMKKIDTLREVIARGTHLVAIDPLDILCEVINYEDENGKVYKEMTKLAIINKDITFQSEGVSSPGDSMFYAMCRLHERICYRWNYYVKRPKEELTDRDLVIRDSMLRLFKERESNL